MLSLSPTLRIFLCLPTVDLRKSFDGLRALVAQTLVADPLSGHWFVFRNRAGDRLKILGLGRGRLGHLVQATRTRLLPFSPADRRRTAADRDSRQRPGHAARRRRLREGPAGAALSSAGHGQVKRDTFPPGLLREAFFIGPLEVTCRCHTLEPLSFFSHKFLQSSGGSCVQESMSTAASPVAVPDTDHLPDDPALLKAMLAELLAALRSRDRELEQVQHRLDQLLRRLYGPRAERFDPDQPLLFAELTAATAAPAPPAPPPNPEAACRKRPGHGRQQLPKHLPRERRVYELSTAERNCSCCGQERQVIGQEVSEQLDYLPASLRVIEHVRLTYACPRCVGAKSVAAEVSEAVTAAAVAEVATETTEPATIETAAPANPTAPSAPIVTAPKPAVPIPRGLPAPGLLAYLIVSKFGDHCVQGEAVYEMRVGLSWPGCRTRPQTAGKLQGQEPLW